MLASVGQNPCSALGGDQYFPLPGSPQCYIQCAFDNAVIKACPSILVWNQAIQVCDWPGTAAPLGSDVGYGSSSYGGGNQNYGSPSYGGGNQNYGSPSYGGGNNYAPSAPLPVRTIPDSGSSYSYGRKKRATTERKKRGNYRYNGNSGGSYNGNSGGSYNGNSGGSYNGNSGGSYKNGYDKNYGRNPRRGSTIISEVPLGK